ncbi:hypothetical protein P7C73_g6105, partial [Tremellales sp. Uapishka_1]
MVARFVHPALYEHPEPDYYSPLSDPQEPPPRTFPLYRSPSSEPSKVDLSTLPSRSEIQRTLKHKLTVKATKNVPEPDEETLRHFYTSLVESGREETENDHIKEIEAPRGRMGKEKRGTLIAGLEERLNGVEGLVKVVREGKKAQNIANILLEMTLGEEASSRGDKLPLGIVSRGEWEALFEELIQQQDARGADALLQIMQTDAEAGRVEGVMNRMSEMIGLGLSLKPSHYDALVLSHLRSLGHQYAISLLTTYEEIGQPLPLSSYNLVLSHLLLPSPNTQPTSHTRSLGWDLFAHLRLAAHPIPSREIFTTMIRACGDANEPQPERARDLWVEMTTEGEKLTPRREEYEALMRAVGSLKSGYLEAFELLREMLARHHEATFVPFQDGPNAGTSPYIPTVETFIALLEGTKRAGDLNRARWILLEAVKLAQGGPGIKGPNEELMSGVFMTYAAWKPAVGRERVKVGTTEKEANEALESPAVLEGVSNEESTDIDGREENDTTSTTPQSASDAIREATTLFDNILHHSKHPSDPQYAFSKVKLTSRLVNSYLSVHLAHQPSIQTSRSVVESTWVNLKAQAVEKNGWSYLHVLEKLHKGYRTGLDAVEKQAIYDWGKNVWTEYRAWTQNQLTKDGRKKWTLGISERQVEKCWIAVIRLHAIFGHTEEAMRTMDEFFATYPPEDILVGYSPIEPSSLKIRLTTTATTPEPNVPPHILFSDVDVLHQRLVRDEQGDHVRKLGWMVRSYEKALKKRRNWRIGGAGLNREKRRRQRGATRDRTAIPAGEGGE